MDSFLSRYRNLTVLLMLVVAQLLLLGYQVKSNRDVRLIRVWAVSAITPLAQVLETMRSHTFGVFEDYFVLLGIREQNQKLRDELGRLKMQNQFLKTQLSDADRGRALASFQAQTPSKTLAARIIANGTGSNSATVFVDRGSNNGVESGMAVVTPEGIVGRVIAAYPTASLVLLATDPTFAAGVVSQKNHVSGTLKGQGHGQCIVDYIQNEQKVEPGEWFYTSGYDRVFPRGFPVGTVSAVRNGRNGKEVYLNPAGLQGGPEAVLIVLQGVHQAIPENAPPAPGMHLMLPPPEAEAAAAAAQAGQPALATEADHLREAYQKLSKVENHAYGTPGAVPNFNLKPPEAQIPGATPRPAEEGTQARAITPGASAAQPSAPIPSANPKIEAHNNGTIPARAAPQTGSPTPNPLVTKRKNTANASRADPSTIPQRVPRVPSGPLLVTDPADADPSAPEVLRTLAKPQPKTETPQALDALGQPVAAKKAKPKPPAKKPAAIKPSPPVEQKAQ